MKSYKVCWKLFVSVLLLKVFTSSGVSDAKKVYCENFSDLKWVGSNKEAVKTCYKNTTTSIDEPGLTISSRDVSVKGLYSIVL